LTNYQQQFKKEHEKEMLKLEQSNNHINPELLKKKMEEAWQKNE